jgi:hypothetical protein
MTTQQEPDIDMQKRWPMNGWKENKVTPPQQEPKSVTYKEVADAMNSLWNGTLEQHQIAEQMANKKLYTTPAQPAQQEPVAWMRPSEEGYDSAFRDHSTVMVCTGNPWTGWIPLYTTPPQPEERNFCPRCGKRTADLTTIHTCTPPQETTE